MCVMILRVILYAAKLGLGVLLLEDRIYKMLQIPAVPMTVTIEWYVNPLWAWKPFDFAPTRWTQWPALSSGVKNSRPSDIST